MKATERWEGLGGGGGRAEALDSFVGGISSQVGWVYPGRYVSDQFVSFVLLCLVSVRFVFLLIHLRCEQMFRIGFRDVSGR